MEKQNIEFKAIPEFEGIKFNEEGELLMMASMKAPLFEQNEEDKRAPVDLCCVIDKSGSMAGAKLALVKSAMEFVLKNLDQGDSLSIVVYDTVVQTPLHFMKMNKDGKEIAKKTIENIVDGSSTNLSGGLLQGLENVSKRKEPNEICSILLLTDGLANHGITNTTQIVGEMEKKLEEIKLQGKSCTVFTFGFGSDHDENMLRRISEAGKGLYYFVENLDKIPTSFADCLGGLQSVVGQNISLSLEAANGCLITKNLNTRYKVNGTLPSNTLTLELGDIYSEEERDLVFLMKVPKLDQETDKFDCANLSLSYFNVLSTQDIQAQTTLTISRPSTISEDVKPNIQLDIQRNRLQVAEAIEKGRDMANRGEYKNARDLLTKIKDNIRTSPSSREAFCGKLIQDLDQCYNDLEDPSDYQTRGSKAFMRKMMSHGQQRSTRVEDTDVDYYETSAKSRSKMSSSRS